MRQVGTGDWKWLVFAIGGSVPGRKRVYITGLPRKARDPPRKGRGEKRTVSTRFHR